MSEKIKLRVPKKTEAEYVSQGNFEAELKPNGIVETTSRRFADWLIAEHKLQEITAEVPKTNVSKKQSSSKAKKNEPIKSNNQPETDENNTNTDGGVK